MRARKADTRDKIQLGGLIIKAGLRDTNKAVILGALLKAAHALNTENSSSVEAEFKKLGEAAFAQKED